MKFEPKILLTLLAAFILGLSACSSATPERIVETVVVEKEVQGETVTVVETVEVIKTVEVVKEVTVEIIKEVEAAPETGAYNEAPVLAARVQANELPPAGERLPEVPLVVQPNERVGKYGGDWHTAVVGGLDHIWMIRTMAYENLVRYNPEWTAVIPNIAESFEVNDDATEFTFKLRRGMKWSDGQPFTADDIMFWYNDVLLNTDLTPTVPAWLVTGGEPVVVEKIDEFTVAFKFNTPNGLFLQNLGAVIGCGPTGYPRHYLEQFHPTYNDDLEALIAEAGVDDWVGLFQLKGGVEPCAVSPPSFWQTTEVPTLHAWMITTPFGAGTQVVAERNPYYFKVDIEGNQLPYLDRVIYDQLEDAEVLVLKALNGELDMQARHFSLKDKAVLFDGMDQAGFRFVDMTPASANTTSISLNLTHPDPVKREIFQNKDFRIGLSHAINRQEIIDVLKVGQGEPAQVAVLEQSPFYNEALAKQYTEYDVDLANEYLDRAGYTERNADGIRLGPDGQPISIVIELSDLFGEQWPDMMEMIQGYWREVGVDLQIKVEDRSLLFSRKAANEHDAVVWGGGPGTGSALLLNPSYFLPCDPVDANYAMAWVQWCLDPAAGEEPPEAVKNQIALYQQLKATADPAEQAALMEEILAIAQDQFYVIGISVPTNQFGIAKNEFHGVPGSFPFSWFYPNPAPTNTAQYFIE